MSTTGTFVAVSVFALALAGVEAQQPATPAQTGTNTEGKRVEQALRGRKPSPPLTVQDYADIQNLYGRAAHALDSGADGGKAYAGVFTPDGIFIDTPTGKVYVGQDAIAEMVRGSAGSSKGVHHLFQNVMIEHSVEGSFVKAYVSILQHGAAGQPASVVDSGQYWDVLVRTPDGWRFKKRNFHRATPAVPGLPQPAAARGLP